ncbi:hypothetical protein AAFC00_000170 [Neodothiora populina]|uniref:NAD-dependent epimerase/dehydratase domain-containing protein n=1 Tax=Neodothiora populina TaxID=2781224 RepID=A0ABR3P313_9PEZI
MASAASSAARKKIVVAGGNGFLGSRICKAATARGWHVVSLSRSGEPTWSSVTSSPTAPAWSKDVEWISANVLHPSTYRAHLRSADSVVHSMGILLEADYKGVLQGKEPLVAGLQRAFSSTKKGTQDPFARTGDEGTFEPQEDGGQITYEVMNRDSAILLAKETAAAAAAAAAAEGIDGEATTRPTFCYVSAAGGAPVLPRRYIDTKRAAEQAIALNLPSLRSVFVRPGMLFDASRGFTMPLAAATWVGAMANSLVGGALSGVMGAGGVKPLKADVVAEAIVEAIDDGVTKGPVEVRGIEELATRSWRKGML